MKVILFGGAGTIGRAVADTLSDRHDLVRIGRSSGDRRADLTDPDSLRALFEAEAPFDAVVCAAGEAAFGALADLSDDDFRLSLESKLMGQVNLVRVALPYVADGGSFTLTSGVLSQHPIPGSAAISLVNAGVEAFVRAAALELPRGVRANAVSPPWVRETLEAMGRDPAPGLPAATVAQAYVASVEGGMSGQVIDAQDYTGQGHISLGVSSY
jgi:NAD(P)-dependent dehydrogenase (short-subunit alcohol dehydrogenase family)